VLPGKIVGFFETFVVDTIDDDLVPDLQRLSGSITFTPSVTRIIDESPAIPGEPQVTSAVLGALPYRAKVVNGFLSTPATGAKWLYVISTDDPNANPRFTNYDVSYDLSDFEGRKVDLPTHSIAVPPYLGDGDEVDLAQLIPPANAPAYGIPQAEAAANRAVAALAKAVRKVNGVTPDADGNVQVSVTSGTSYPFTNLSQVSLTHNLNRLPAVAVFDASGPLDTDYTVTTTTAVITFPSPRSGTIILT
jgi:nucleoid-associated protein YgaU